MAKKWYEYVGNQAAIIAGVFLISNALIQPISASLAKRFDKVRIESKSRSSATNELPPYSADQDKIKQHLKPFFENLKQHGLSVDVRGHSVAIKSRISALEDHLITAAKIGLYTEATAETLELLAQTRSLFSDSFELAYIHSKLLMREGNIKEAKELLEEVPEENLSEYEKSRLFSALGQLHIHEREFISAEYYVNRSLAYEIENVVSKDLANSFMELAVIEYEKRSIEKHVRQEELAKAEEFLNRALEALEKAQLGTQPTLQNEESKFIKASIYINYANVFVEQGKNEKAKDILENNISSLVGEERFTELAHTYFTLGGLELKEGDLNSAIQRYSNSVMLSRKANNKDMLVRALSNFGSTLAQACRLPEAKSAVDEALALGSQNKSDVAFAKYFRAFIEIKMVGVTRQSMAQMDIAIGLLSSVGIDAKFDENTAQKVAISC